VSFKASLNEKLVPFDVTPQSPGCCSTTDSARENFTVHTPAVHDRTLHFVGSSSICSETYKLRAPSTLKAAWLCTEWKLLLPFRLHQAPLGTSGPLHARLWCRTVLRTESRSGGDFMGLRTWIRYPKTSRRTLSFSKRVRFRTRALFHQSEVRSTIILAVMPRSQVSYV
jgi:hypothetical protein